MTLSYYWIAQGENLSYECSHIVRYHIVSSQGTMLM